MRSFASTRAPPGRTAIMSLRTNALLFAAVVAASVTAITMASPPPEDRVLADARPAPEFRGIDNWFNSAPLTLDGLRGKVVLVDFWIYTCSNCLNHLPYVRQWHEKYQHKGLVVVGVHTPEFPFEKSAQNVQDAIKRLQIRHAVAQDNGYATWNAFKNRYWPALYLIDKQGRIVYSHYGEGHYGETEQRIQALLAEPGAAAR